MKSCRKSVEYQEAFLYMLQALLEVCAKCPAVALPTRRPLTLVLQGNKTKQGALDLAFKALDM